MGPVPRTLYLAAPYPTSCMRQMKYNNNNDIRLDKGKKKSGGGKITKESDKGNTF